MDKVPTPEPKLDNPQANNQAPTFTEKDKIILNDTTDTSADVVNNPVAITSLIDMTSNTNNNENSNNEKIELNQETMYAILSSAKKPFLKLGKIVQSYISKLSDKIQVQSSYKYFLIFLAMGLLLYFFALLNIPFILFSPGKYLSLLTFGNIFIMVSFFFYYGSKDFFAFLVDENRTGVVFAHLLSMCSSLFIYIFIGGYFLQFLLDFILSITTVMFVLTLIPGGKGGISAIKNMLLGPGKLLWNNVKGKIFGNNNDSDLPQ